MNYQNFRDDESYRSEKDLNADNEALDSRRWGSDIFNPNERDYDKIFNSNLSGKLKEKTHAAMCKRILNIAMQMQLNLSVTLHLLDTLDLSQSEDHIINTLLDQYNKHMSKISAEINNDNILQKSKKILQKFDELRHSNPNPTTTFMNNSTRIQIIQNKPSKQQCLVCPICYEEFMNEIDIMKLLCGHYTCKGCFQDYLKNKILVAQVKEFKCPQDECKFIVPESEIRRFLKPIPDLLNKLIKFKKSQEIASDPNVKWCIRPGCENLVRIENPSNPFIKCSSCGQEFCFKCNNPWHPNMPCEEFIDKIYKSYIKSAEVRFCPSCHSLIEKNDGCNHMTCIQCNYQFCWICGKQYSANHYSLFNLNGCPGLQFTNISKSTSPWRRRWQWIKSFLITFLLIICFLVIGPIAAVFMAITFPLQRFFFDRNIRCSSCQDIWTNIMKFFLLLIAGIIICPIIILCFLGFGIHLLFNGRR